MDISSFHAHVENGATARVDAEIANGVRWFDLIVRDGAGRLTLTVFPRSDDQLVAMLSGIAETALRAIHDVAPGAPAQAAFEAIAAALDDVVFAVERPAFVVELHDGITITE